MKIPFFPSRRTKIRRVLPDQGIGTASSRYNIPSPRVPQVSTARGVGPIRSLFNRGRR